MYGSRGALFEGAPRLFPYWKGVADRMDYQKLMDEALKARENAYAPYSNFLVGAALLGASGRLYLGCNVENASYGGSACAERVAIWKAVSEGEQSFTALAIAGGQKEDKILTPCYPCGMCRQVMREFCGPDFRVITGSGKRWEALSLRKLLPYSFGPDRLQKQEGGAAGADV